MAHLSQIPTLCYKKRLNSISNRLVLMTVNIEKERPSPADPRQNQIIESENDLSVDLGVKMYVKDAGSLSVEGMYKKASELVAVPGNITAAPGCHADAKVVTSRSGIKPHIVMPGKAKGSVCM